MYVKVGKLTDLLEIIFSGTTWHFKILNTSENFGGLKIMFILIGIMYFEQDAW